jgi:cellulose synthase/poly-beta-1,6-N-acetylglucosamine synthase-like glycosyltransferase
MLIVFWLCFFLIVFVYVGYPLLLASGFLGRRLPIARRSLLPNVSVIIPAHNEEKSIRQKLENLLQLDYPSGQLEILVGNDGSQDRTASVVRAMMSDRVKLIDSPSQRGKSAIQNELVARSSGQILVFTDADCLIPQDALRTILENFADPHVGLVTNCAAILNPDETPVVESEGLYWKYERWLRRQESERGLLAMASGSLFAMRRELWRKLDPNVGDDFALPLRVARFGFRNVLDTRVSAQTMLTQNQPQSMFRMKMRIISKDLRGLLRNPACLNPLQVGRVAVGLWSHKLLRWLIPYFLICLLLSNVFLAGRNFYGAFLVAQLLFYILSAAGLLFRNRALRFPLSAAASFCLVNAAALMGTLHCLTWQPAGQWKTVR